MTTHRASGVHEPPYVGALGVTRREHFYVPTPDGAARRVELVTAINTLTDPVLARHCLDGSLHRVDGVEHALPVVYHDPANRRFVLVVPAARAHEDLTLRAALLQQLAAETSERLPAYVREAPAVVGPAGLRAWLDRGLTAPRDPAAVAREERIEKRAEDVTRREDDLRAREAALAAKEGALAAKEESLAADDELMRANMAALAAREKVLRAREDELDRREAALVTHAETVPPLDGVLEIQPESVEDRMELEPEETTGRISVVTSPPLDAPAGAARETLELDPLPLQELLAHDDGELHDDEVSELEPTPTPEPEPERDSWASLPRVAVVEGAVRLWLRGGTDEARALAAGDVSPVLQADPDGAAPLALLSLRDAGGGTLARVALDLTRPDDRAVIDALARDFRLRAELVSPAGRALAVQGCSAPCEGVAQRAVEVLSRRAPGSAESRADAAARMVESGIDDEAAARALRAVSDEQSLTTAEGVRAVMQAWTPLLDASRAEGLSLRAGVAPSQVESAARRLVLAAMRCGEPLTDALRDRALALGLAPDEKTLAARALTAYARAVEAGVESIGRSPADASRAWKPLLARAASLRAAIPDGVAPAVAAVWDPDDTASTPPPDDRAPPDATAMRSMTSAELDAWRWHPTARLDAALARAAREELREAATLLGAMRWLPAGEAARVAAELLAHGDALGDLWVELLGSRRQGLACVGAAGAGVLRMRRALSPLVQRATAADNDDWRLMAWAAGCFGPALVRAAARLDAAEPERLAWMLGHAVAHGGAREMERAKGESPHFAECATRALGMQDELRAWSEALRRGDAARPFERAVHPIIARGEGSAEA